MFSNQELDYSLHLPTRCLSAVAPPSAPPPPTHSSPRVDDDQSTAPNDDGDDIVAGASSAGDGWDDDDDAIDAIDNDYDDYHLASSTWTTTHRFLVGTALPSASQFDLDSDHHGDGDGDGDDDQPHNDDKALEDYLLTPLEALAEDDDDDNDHNDNNNVNNHHGIRENRLHLLQYREDAHELTCERSWRHPPGEVFAVACHPRKEEWVVTCGGGSVFTSLGGSGSGSGRKDRVARFQTTLWRLPPALPDGREDSGFDDEHDVVDDDAEHVGDDDFQWGSNDRDNYNYNRNNDKPRKRTTSSNSANELERLVVIPHGCQQHSSISSYGGWEQRVGCILWHPDLSPSSSSSDLDHSINNDHSLGDDDVTTSTRGNLLTVGWDERSPVCLWDLSSSNARQLWSTSPHLARPPQRTRRNRLSPLQTSLPRRASWNPHHPHNILVASGTDVLSHDVRRPSREHESLAIRAAHRLGVADVSHDHSREHLVLTSGMDGVVKFWDWRMPHHSVWTSSPSSSSPMSENIHHGHDEPASPPLLLKAVRGGHSHWVTRATYNPFYDQLILSAGRDGIANLWRISSCSSAPLLDLDDNDDDDVDDDADYDDADGGLEGDAEGDGEERHVDGIDDKENRQREWMTMGNTTRSHDEDDDHENHEQEDNRRYDHPEMDDDSDERHNRNPAKTDKSSSKSTNTVSTAQDVRVTKYECSDAVADITWCSTDPWLYATLSCDGGVVVHHVPSKEKYKILL